MTPVWWRPRVIARSCRGDKVPKDRTPVLLRLPFFLKQPLDISTTATAGLRHLHGLLCRYLPLILLASQFRFRSRIVRVVSRVEDFTESPRTGLCYRTRFRSRIGRLIFLLGTVVCWRLRWRR